VETLLKQSQHQVKPQISILLEEQRYFVCCVRPVDRHATHVGISTCCAGFYFFPAQNLIPPFLLMHLTIQETIPSIACIKDLVMHPKQNLAAGTNTML